MKEESTVTAVTDHTTDTAQIILSYSPGGTNVTTIYHIVPLADASALKQHLDQFGH